MGTSSSVQFLNPGDDLWNFVQSHIHDESLELYDLARPRSDQMRIFIDRKKVSDVTEGSEETVPKRRGSRVTADDCTTICRRLMDAFVVEGAALGISSSPELEVSSPGLDRSLRLREHFISAIGSKVKIWLEGKSVLGVLHNFENDIVVFGDESSGIVSEIAFSDIRKAQTVY
jgi:ribosome maturation factor RimP